MTSPNSPFVVGMLKRVIGGLQDESSAASRGIAQ